MHIKIGNPWTWWKESYNVRYGIGLVITVILTLVHFGLIYLWGVEAFKHPTDNILPMIFYLWCLLTTSVWIEIQAFLLLWLGIIRTKVDGEDHYTDMFNQ